MKTAFLQVIAFALLSCRNFFWEMSNLRPDVCCRGSMHAIPLAHTFHLQSIRAPCIFDIVGVLRHCPCSTVDTSYSPLLAPGCDRTDVRNVPCHPAGFNSHLPTVTPPSSLAISRTCVAQTFDVLVVQGIGQWAEA